MCLDHQRVIVRLLGGEPLTPHPDKLTGESVIVMEPLFLENSSLPVQ